MDDLIPILIIIGVVGSVIKRFRAAMKEASEQTAHPHEDSETMTTAQRRLEEMLRGEGGPLAPPPRPAPPRPARPQTVSPYEPKTPLPRVAPPVPRSVERSAPRPPARQEAAAPPPPQRPRPQPQRRPAAPQPSPVRAAATPQPASPYATQAPRPAPAATGRRAPIQPGTPCPKRRTLRLHLNPLTMRQAALLSEIYEPPLALRPERRW